MRSIRVRRSSWDSSFISSTPQSLRSPGVLHAACLGVEGQSQRRVRELAPQRFVRVTSSAKPPLISADSDWQPLRSACQIEEAAQHKQKNSTTIQKKEKIEMSTQHRFPLLT